VIGANLCAAADLFHQAVDKPQTVPVAVAVVSEAYSIVPKRDCGLVGREDCCKEMLILPLPFGKACR